ncbi:MAG: VanZ family protein [Clostridia bacterium]|nr:VanZ family protein [Clostridia bacterium]
MTDTNNTVEIPFLPVMAGIIIIWLIIRAAACIVKRKFDPKCELWQLAALFTVCLVVRFTFFPTFRDGGYVQPLVFDPDRMKDYLINLEPLYYIKKLWGNKINFIINEIGNILLFIPVGIVWPAAFPRLRAFWKTLIAGAAFSCLIEICQLPFFDRTTDIDDVILNTVGCAIGYALYAIFSMAGKSIVKNS